MAQLTKLGRDNVHELSDKEKELEENARIFLNSLKLGENFKIQFNFKNKSPKLVESRKVLRMNEFKTSVYHIELKHENEGEKTRYDYFLMSEIIGLIGCGVFSLVNQNNEVIN